MSLGGSFALCGSIGQSAIGDSGGGVYPGPLAEGYHISGGFLTGCGKFMSKVLVPLVIEWKKFLHHVRKKKAQDIARKPWSNYPVLLF